ncbi:MAG: hypothetical protein FJ091_15610 [Deltaproteobacteria bacterium]|nr:hypothetical protein [Deltaproteobacteria bacterium]
MISGTTHGLELRFERIGGWTLPVVAFARSARTLSAFASALIGNSVTTSKPGANRTKSWKLAVAGVVKAQRGPAPWISEQRIAISLGFTFHAASHGNRPLDIENFLKPTLDAIAAGLFAANEIRLEEVTRWHFDDSGFRDLYAHRLPDVATAAHEGAAVFVCAER